MSSALIEFVLDTPVGPLAVVVDPDAVGDLGPTSYGAVIASGFTGLDDQRARLGAADQARPRERGGPQHPVAVAVAAYGEGNPRALDTISVSQPESALLARIRTQMRAIPPGSTLTYGALAAQAGRPDAARAAGGACSRNLVAPFVPCHRVVPAGGGLGGYYYGTAVKSGLLDHEAVTA